MSKYQSQLILTVDEGFEQGRGDKYSTGKDLSDECIRDGN